MQDQAESLNRAENQRGLLEGARRKLEHFLSKQVESVNATITVGDVGMLTVQFLGRVLVAAPRTVFVDGDLALEYTFAEQGWAEGLAVWQFYLVEEAQHKYGLYAGLPPDDRKRICDFDNTRAPTHIVTGLGMALLASPSMKAQPL